MGFGFLSLMEYAIQVLVIVVVPVVRASNLDLEARAEAVRTGGHDDVSALGVVLIVAMPEPFPASGADDFGVVVLVFL